MKQIFINIPVNDLIKSMQFYIAIGFTINPLFTDEDQKCLMWNESIYVMLQNKRFFTSYLNKPLVDAKEFQTLSHTLPVDSVELVNKIMENGLNAGGKEPVAELQEEFMFLRSIEDLDGHLWGIMHLDVDLFKLKKNEPPHTL